MPFFLLIPIRKVIIIIDENLKKEISLKSDKGADPQEKIHTNRVLPHHRANFSFVVSRLFRYHQLKYSP